MAKCIIYARFSPRSDEETSRSNQTQIALCEDWARKEGHEVAMIFQDRAKSGKNLKRDGIWNAIEQLKPGYLLIVAWLDRLSRSVYDLMYLEELVHKKSAVLRSIKGEGTEGSSNEDRMVRQILTVFAEYRRRADAARTSASMQRHQDNGRRMGRIDMLPYGSKPDPEDDKLTIPDPYEQEIIRVAVKMRQNAASCGVIAKKLNEDGYRARNGKKWHYHSVYNVIERYRYLWIDEYNKWKELGVLNKLARKNCKVKRVNMPVSYYRERAGRQLDMAAW